MPLRAGAVVMAASLLLAAQRAEAQHQILVRVRVVDSIGALVPGADIAIASSVNAVLAKTTSDASASRLLRFTTMEDSYEVVVRKLGYARVSRFVIVSLDTARVEILLAKSAMQLAGVNVTGEVSRKRERTFIDADAIAASDRTFYDAIDVIQKLRPDMTFEPPDPMHICPGLQNMWVNGSRVTVPGERAKAPPVNTKLGQRVRDPSNRFHSALQGASDDMLDALSMIKPEHIASVEYSDCMHPIPGKIGSESALYVTLKEGIGFQNARGSYILPQVAAGRTPAMPKPAANVVTRSLDLDGHAAPLAAYRSRILGVFDADSGSALTGVDVRDVQTGSGSLTSTTGTVSLVFLSEMGGRVALTKAGFRPDTITVRISPTDTVPVTAVLSRIK